MKRHEKLVDKDAIALDISEARELRQELRTWKQESLERIHIMDQEQSSRDFQSILSWLRIHESDQEVIFDSVSSQGNKYPGTCSWVIQHPKFQSWLQRRPETPLLWLMGAAGSGKSVISSQLVNFMVNAKMTVLYHLCTHSSASSAYDQILKTLLQQLLRQDGELTAHVYGEYVLRKRTATPQALEQLLQMLLTTSSNDPKTTNYIWIIVDGVDELREESPNIQARLLSVLKQISSRTTALGGVVCKVLICSRPSPTIIQVLSRVPTVSLTDEKKSLTKSIEEYASQRLREVNNKFEQLGIGSEEIEGIVRQVSAKADGKISPSYRALTYTVVFC
jgi:archaellum biogenesis ATPase FlaH